MILDYKGLTETKTIPQSSIYMIHGSPRILQNEIEKKIENYYKNYEFLSKKNFILDTDSSIEEIENELQSLSLFDEKKIITINIVSKTLPSKIKTVLTKNLIPESIKIILKLDRQQSSFKKNAFYQMCSKSECVIEVYELQGAYLKNWVKNKLIKNQINFSDELCTSLIEKNEGNTLSIAQELYKLTLLEKDFTNENINKMNTNYKFNEFSLIDAIHDADLIKSYKILDYLKLINVQRPFILFLLNNEIKKIYNLKNNNDCLIPTFKLEKYKRLTSKYNNDILEDFLRFSQFIDLNIKSNKNNIDTWHLLSVLISCFVLNIPSQNYYKDKNGTIFN